MRLHRILQPPGKGGRGGVLPGPSSRSSTENYLLINPLTPGAFCKKCFLEILVVIRLDLGQISFNLVENAFATQQLAFLATSIAFYHIVTRAYAEIKNFCTRKWPTSLGFSIFGIFFAFAFSPFLFFLLL